MPKYSLPDNGAVIISGSAADKLIAAKDSNTAFVYLYVLKTGDVSTDGIADALGITKAAAEKCLYSLSVMGLINTHSGSSAEDAPEYTAEEIASAMKNDGFSFVVEQAEIILGSALGSEELKKLYNIHRNLGFPPEVIVHMMQFFKGETRRKYGPGRRMSMSAFEKMAYSWSKQGIVTLDSAEEHIRKLEYRASVEGEIKRALDIYDRNLTPGEKVYIDSWTDMGFSPEAIRIAYERTIDRVHSRSFKYMDKIFLSWHKKGLHTPVEINSGDPYERVRRPAQDTTGSAAPSPGASAEDLDSVRRFIESMKED